LRESEDLQISSDIFEVIKKLKMCNVVKSDTECFWTRH